MAGAYETALKEAHRRRRATFFDDNAVLIARASSPRRARVIECFQGVVLIELADQPRYVIDPVRAIAVPMASGFSSDPGDFIDLPQQYYPLEEYSLDHQNPLTPIEIIRATARREKTPVAVEDIVGDDRTKAVARARHKAIWRVAIAIPKLSLPSLGRHFNDRDHTTIMHAIAAHDKRLRELGQAVYIGELMMWGSMPLSLAVATWRHGIGTIRKTMSPGMKKVVERGGRN